MERYAFVLDHQHDRRDIMCKRAIGRCPKFFSGRTFSRDNRYFKSCTMELRYNVVTKTRKDPQRSTTIHNDPQRPTTIFKRPRTISKRPTTIPQQKKLPKKKISKLHFWIKQTKLRVRGRINSFTATKEDFITCFEGQGCLSRVMNECLAVPRLHVYHTRHKK